MKTNKLWFKAKNFGWGWQPISPEGWVVTLLYVTAIVLNVKNVDMYSHSNSDTLINLALPFIINTVFLLIICYIKGEKPRWRWDW